MTQVSSLRRARTASAAAFSVIALALGGCASNYGGNTVSPNAVGVASTVRPGIVTAVREVQITPEQSVLGMVVGGALGGLAGSELGGGDKAQTAGGIAGAVIGGVAGNEAGKRLNTRKGYAYMIEMTDPRTGQPVVREIIQGNDILIQPGTPVNVTFGSDRVRVAPAAGVVVSR